MNFSCIFRFIVYYITVCCQTPAYLRPPLVLILRLFLFYTEKMEQDYREILFRHSLQL